MADEEPEIDPAAEPSLAPPADPPSGSPAGRRRPGGAAPVTRGDYLGCGLWALGFLVLVVVSFGVGAVLRPDGDANEAPGAVTLAERGQGENAYRLVGRTDETDAPCVTLLPAGSEESADAAGAEGAGTEGVAQCGLTTRGPDGDEPERYTVSSAELPDGTTVAFGPLPRQADAVRLHLSDGSTPTIEARRSASAGFSWFVHETDQEIDGPPEMLDANGDPVTP